MHVLRIAKQCRVSTTVPLETNKHEGTAFFRDALEWWCCERIKLDMLPYVPMTFETQYYYSCRRDQGPFLMPRRPGICHYLATDFYVSLLLTLSLDSLSFYKLSATILAFLRIARQTTRLWGVDENE